MKITVTGSAGFIGSHYVKKASADCTVFGFDRKLLQDVEYVELPDCDAVIHLAATNGTRRFYEQPTDILINDTRATFKVVERYQNTNTKIVFASSCEIFNSAIDLDHYAVPTDESVPVMFADIKNPRWSYSLPKAVGENLVANCGNPWLTIRYFNIYGPGQTDHFINEFVERVKQGKYYINGNDTRSFCYVDDAVEMTHRLVKNNQNIVVNVGRSEEHQISTVAEKILKIMNIDPNRLEIRSGLKGSVSRRCPNTALVKSLTGFTEYTDLDTGLEKTIESIL
jgi:nucleoside-diphosphate-sugar epimerase